ncbi:MAG: hypothetical protein K0U45_04585 [Alphaproteobacteria bacterium]|nr:hypothetical protein [Alphaproteobacteria bacterium]
MAHDVAPITLADCNDDYDVLRDRCYQHYCDIWLQNPLFNNKPIYRARDLIDGKEESFWGIVDGHNDDKQYEYLRRYETITYFKEIILNVHQSKNNYYYSNDVALRWLQKETDDILWFIFNRKTTIFSIKLNYLIVLNENKKHARLITGFPISEQKKNKMIARWQEYRKT